jgi:hypothetical protein
LRFTRVERTQYFEQLHGWDRYWTDINNDEHVAWRQWDVDNNNKDIDNDKDVDNNKLTVASHRGQETFNCAVMGYRNSVAYVQRIMDTILREFRAFARTYVDDIVIFSRTFLDHLAHLRAVFTKLSAHNIHLSAKKSFLSYPSVQLLGQQVDTLGLATDHEKLLAISKLCLKLRDIDNNKGYRQQYGYRQQ